MAPLDARAVPAPWTGDLPIEARYRLSPDGMMRSFVFDRWGTRTTRGPLGWQPFGGEITGYATFDGLTIPSEGRAGWFFGTDRWPAGVFFRCRVTDLHPVRPAG